MSGQLVSCIIPVRDGKRYIAEALDSIFAQEHRALEVIVVDDGSTDGTRAVVQRYGTRLRYIYSANENGTAARNCGLRASSGDFVAFLDADDLWHREKLTVQLAHLETRPATRFCVCHVQNFFSPDTVDKSAATAPQEPVPGFIASAFLSDRPIFDEVGLFDESLHHGAALDWFLRAREQGFEDALLEDVLVYRRLHGSNLSIQGAEASRREHLGVIRAALRRRRANHPTP